MKSPEKEAHTGLMFLAYMDARAGIFLYPITKVIASKTNVAPVKPRKWTPRARGYEAHDDGCPGFPDPPDSQV